MTVRIYYTNKDVKTGRLVSGFSAMVRANSVDNAIDFLKANRPHCVSIENVVVLK